MAWKAGSAAALRAQKEKGRHQNQETTAASTPAKATQTSTAAGGWAKGSAAALREQKQTEAANIDLTSKATNTGQTTIWVLRTRWTAGETGLTGVPSPRPVRLRPARRAAPPKGNGDDCRQWRKQGGAVGAAASRMQAKRSRRWEPQPVELRFREPLSLLRRQLPDGERRRWMRSARKRSGACRRRTFWKRPTAARWHTGTVRPRN